MDWGKDCETFDYGNQMFLDQAQKWRSSVGGIVGAPLQTVWKMVSQSDRLSEWMPMVERCTKLAGEEGAAGYVRLVSGFMYPQDDGDRLWIKERLVLLDPSSYTYVYKIEASNVGLDGSLNSIQLVDYEDAAIVTWSFEIDPVEGASQEDTVDFWVSFTSLASIE